MPDEASKTKQLLKCLSDLRWAFKRLAADVVSELGEERAQGGGPTGPTWHFMGDGESVGYTDGQTVALAVGATAYCEVTIFWQQDGLRIVETVAVETDDDQYRVPVFGPSDVTVPDVASAIAALQAFLAFVSAAGTAAITDAVTEVERWRSAPPG